MTAGFDKLPEGMLKELMRAGSAARGPAAHTRTPTRSSWPPHSCPCSFASTLPPRPDAHSLPRTLRRTAPARNALPWTIAHPVRRRAAAAVARSAGRARADADDGADGADGAGAKKRRRVSARPTVRLRTRPRPARPPRPPATPTESSCAGGRGDAGAPGGRGGVLIPGGPHCQQ